MMFQKQNTYKNSFSCEPCEGTCEPFSTIINTLKAFDTNQYSNNVNDVNHFFARARERENHFYTFFDYKLYTSENTLTREIYIKSFTSFTCLITYCLYSFFYVNDCLKSFTQSFTSFTWVQ